MSVSFTALGTTVTLVAADPAADEPARLALVALLEDVDRACSRFRADSALRSLNASAGRRVAVDELLFGALEVAVEAARATGGLVDPTVGRALRLSGYDTTFRIVAARDGSGFRALPAAVPGWQSIELDAERRTVRVPAGLELDLGATAKALAADRGACAAAAAAGCGVLVSLGGDIAVAGSVPDGGWPVGLADDCAGAPLPGCTVAISGGGLATSSTTVRRWRSGQIELHHIIDPRTGRSAVTPWRSVSVAGASCVAANTASTAAIILGDAAPAWLAACGLPARLAGDDGAVCVAGWPEPVAA